MYVTSIMTYNPVTISPNASIRDAAMLMRRKNIGSLVVVDSEKKNVMEGMITERDIVENTAYSEKDPSSVKIYDVMIQGHVSIRSDANIWEAADMMIKKGLKKLPVVDNGFIVGILSERDLMEVVRISNNSPINPTISVHS